MEQKQVTIEKVAESDVATMYTIRFENDSETEFEKFYTQFRDSAEYSRDFQIIASTIAKMLELGFRERNFRPEGRMADDLCALDIHSRKLRLYCLRLSDKYLIVGNGGVKNARTYEECEDLKGYAIDLQKLDAILRDMIRRGIISTEECSIIEGQQFDLC